MLLLLILGVVLVLAGALSLRALAYVGAVILAVWLLLLVVGRPVGAWGW